MYRATRCAVLSYAMLLRRCYAMSGIYLRCAASRAGPPPWTFLGLGWALPLSSYALGPGPIVLGPIPSVLGTGPIVLRFPSTDLAYTSGYAYAMSSTAYAMSGTGTRVSLRDVRY
eukprot:839591-Rhodomonas_salina.2